MRTKLETIKWALAHIDKVVYFDGKSYQIVGVGLVSDRWVILCRVKNGWTKLYFDDCILSDLSEEDDNQFYYLPINVIEEKWEEKKI